MYYGLIALASLLSSFQFLFNNGYEKENGSGWRSALNFSFYSSIAGAVLMFIICRFKVGFTLYAFIITAIHAVVGILYSFASVKAFENANLSVYSIFAMLGGMMLPFLFGTIFCDEELTVMKIICCLLIIVALFFTVEKGNKSKGAVKYYISIFVLNGMYGVLSKIHLMNEAQCIDSSSFLFLSRIITVAICPVLLLIAEKDGKKLAKKSYAFCSGYALFSTVGNLLILISLEHLPASVQYPMITGGVIVFSVIIGAIFGERPTKKEVVSAIIASGATVLMMF